MEEKRKTPNDTSPAESMQGTMGESYVMDNHGEPDQNAAPGLQRKLKARHIQMIAIGSNIGTGLFVGSGLALNTGGPAALVAAFILIGVALMLMMQALCEMTVILPVSGSFTRYATRFIDPALGFAMGWQYWLCWVAVFAAEATASNILIKYWTDKIPTAAWITIFICIQVAIHCCPVRVFGEVEFLVSTLKVIAVIVFIIITWVIMAGGGPTGQKHGAEYWSDPGALANGFKGLAAVFVTAAFACGGTEMVGIVSGESEAPRYNLPRAIKTLMARIFIFYVVTMLFLTFVVPYNSDRLLGARTAASSPFVIAIENAGIKVLPHILNAVILICVLSVGSVSIYISSRVMVAMAEDGFAWSRFARTDREGRPVLALIVTGICGSGLAFLNCSETGAQVFSWFTSLSGLAFFIAWLVIFACNWRFHAALKAQGDKALEDEFNYNSPFWPYPSIIGAIAVAFMIACQFYVCVSPVGKNVGDAKSFFSGFIGMPVFLVMWIGYKVIKRTKVIDLKDIDLNTGRRPIDEAEIQMMMEYRALPRWRKAMSYVHF